MLAWIAAGIVFGAGMAELPHHLWLEAESFGPLRGTNFSFQQPDQQTRGSWSVAGPDVAAAWTQGGESEFMSIAARADEPEGTNVRRLVEIPAAGQYTLWVRYADYRGKQEAFGVRVRQGGQSFSHTFGLNPVVDELDPMKLLWDWAFGWDSVTLPLQKGAAEVELFTTGATEARRQVDCLCLTTDPSYRPTGRDKPRFAAWAPLRAMRAAGMPDVQPLQTAHGWTAPEAWRIAEGPPAFLWNVGEPWWDELKKPGSTLPGAAPDRIDAPFGVDPPLLDDFLAAFRGKAPPVYSHPLSGPVWHIPFYPTALADRSPFLEWLARNPARKFAVLLNYGEPRWPAGVERTAVRTNLRRFQDRFVGFIAGESIADAPVDEAALEREVRAARSRTEVLAALRRAHTAAARAKFAAYSGSPVAADEVWEPIVPCLSAGMEAWAHALCDWGVRRIGHESTGNSPALARRLAFLRGAARQFGARIIDYQSCNLGDAATIYSRQSYFYPASSRYILDNQYDAWAGAGINWLLKDYLLWHLAGVEAFYHEEGVDIFWKPGGGSAGDAFPVQLSPKGKVADAVQRLVQSHPRGTQFTPVAFLVDEAHGWSQERFQPGAFGLDPQLNPRVLTPGRHEANLRGWFDIAYYPAPETQNEPATAIRQTYVNGIFGDIFDVIATAPTRTAIASTYPVLIAAGEIPVSTEWGQALREYVSRGGTLVVCADQLSGPGVRELDLPHLGPEREVSAFTWSITGERVPSNRFRFHALPAGKRVLATAPDGIPMVVLRHQGKGQIVLLGVPLGLGIDEQPVPILGLLMRHLTEELVPVKVTGDVEWVLNRLEDGGWLVAIFNNRGIVKPQHGILPTDYREAQAVTLRMPFGVQRSAEWLTETSVEWHGAGNGATTRLTVPAGAVRLVAIYPRS